jgi:hypothetical protein
LYDEEDMEESDPETLQSHPIPPLAHEIKQEMASTGNIESLDSH